MSYMVNYLKGYLIVNGYLENHRFFVLYDMLKEAFEKENIILEIITNKDILQIIDKDIKNKLICDFIIFWDKDILLCEMLEKLGYKVLNSSNTIRICDDKALTYINLINHNINMPKTILMPFSFENIGYNDFSYLDNVIECLGFPMIIKENKGSFGTGVYLINNKEELLKKVKNSFPKATIFQEYINNNIFEFMDISNNLISQNSAIDIRIMTVGKKALGAVMRINEGDYRSNVLSGGKMISLTDNKLNVNNNTIFYPNLNKYLSEAEKISQILDLDFGSVDFLIGKNNQPILCEVNSNAHFKTFYTVTNINLAEELAKYIIKINNNK